MPQGSVNTLWSSMRGLISISAMAVALGQHVRVGNEDNLRGADRTRETTAEQIEGVVPICKAFGRKVANAEDARKICKVGIWYDSVEETLQHNGMPPNPTEFNEVLKVCAAEWVRACNLGVPILAEELERLQAAGGPGRT